MLAFLGALQPSMGRWVGELSSMGTWVNELSSMGTWVGDLSSTTQTEYVCTNS